MVWFGVILWRQGEKSLEFCVEWDCKRKDWELPKGGAQLKRPRRSTRCIDSSAFSTARNELWEECEVWLAWREEYAFEWVTSRGCVLSSGPFAGSAFVCTMLQSDDEVGRKSKWQTLKKFTECSRRRDHKLLLRHVAQRIFLCNKA